MIERTLVDLLELWDFVNVEGYKKPSTALKAPKIPEASICLALKTWNLKTSLK